MNQSCGSPVASSLAESTMDVTALNAEPTADVAWSKTDATSEVASPKTDPIKSPTTSCAISQMLL